MSDAKCPLRLPKRKWKTVKQNRGLESGRYRSTRYMLHASCAGNSILRLLSEPIALRNETPGRRLPSL